MADTENTTPPQPEACACRSGRSLFIWLVVGIAVLTGLGYVAALHYPEQGILVPVEQKASRIDTLEERVEALEKRLAEEAAAELLATTNGTSLNEEIKTLKAEVETKEAKSHQTAHDFIAAAFSFWDLREAAKTGRPFTVQLAALRAAGKKDAKLAELSDKLEIYAASPTPTWTQLREALKAQEKTAPPAPVSETDPVSWKMRIESAMKALISVRPLHDKRFDALNKALDADDRAAAIEAANALPEEVRKAINPWQADLERRIALDDVLRTLTVYFTTPSPEGTAP
ncbi:MAG: hypothetical protein WC464_08305 [Bdellovibrionales bacterium]